MGKEREEQRSGERERDLLQTDGQTDTRKGEVVGTRVTEPFLRGRAPAETAGTAIVYTYKYSKTDPFPLKNTVYNI